MLNILSLLIETVAVFSVFPVKLLTVLFSLYQNFKIPFMTHMLTTQSTVTFNPYNTRK